MRILKKLLLGLCFLPFMAYGYEGVVSLDRAPERGNDLAALQHGAKLFVNYCLNCHSASAMRYSRLKDLGLTEIQIKNNFLFTGAKLSDMMTMAMQPSDSAISFGKIPPDLSVIARAKTTEVGNGANWLYTYLRSFYVDDTRPGGWNNLLVPKSAMPNVLWGLQGSQVALIKDLSIPKKSELYFDKFERTSSGTLSKSEYDDAVTDLVAYLVWMSEPTATERKRLGMWVVLYLLIFSMIVWRLNASYWREVK